MVGSFIYDVLPSFQFAFRRSTAYVYFLLQIMHIYSLYIISTDKYLKPRGQFFSSISCPTITHDIVRFCIFNPENSGNIGSKPSRLMNRAVKSQSRMRYQKKKKKKKKCNNAQTDSWRSIERMLKKEIETRNRKEEGESVRVWECERSSMSQTEWEI